MAGEHQPQMMAGGMLVPSPIDTSSVRSKFFENLAPIYLPTPKTRAAKAVLVRKPYGSEPLEVDKKSGRPTKSLRDVWNEQRKEVHEQQEKAAKESEQREKQAQQQQPQPRKAPPPQRPAARQPKPE